MKTLLNATLGALLLVGGVYLYADDDHDEHESSTVAAQPLSRHDQASAALYQKECGACHMAYQPSLLPKRSWEKTMRTLENHFKTDATLELADHQRIERYLTAYASKNDRITDVKGGVALRISQTPHFLREHREIPKKLIIQPEVKSFANCTACHTKAAGGSYREGEIRIPNYGRWED